MDRFLIETPHRAQDCLDLVDLIHAQGYLTHFDWGCFSGVHTGWAVIDADDEAEARLAVPPLVRAEARIVRVTKIDAAMLAELHKGDSATQCPAVPPIAAIAARPVHFVAEPQGGYK